MKKGVTGPPGKGVAGPPGKGVSPPGKDVEVDEIQGEITIKDLLGSSNVVENTQTTPLLGKTRTVASISQREWIFCVLSTFAVLVCLGLTVQRVVTLDPSSMDFVFALVLLWNTICCMFYIVHGIFVERPFEIIILVVSGWVVLGYCAAEYTVNSDGRTDIKLTRLIVISVLLPFITVIGLYIAFEFYESRRLIFRTVGGREDLQNACWRIFLFEDLMRFDCQLAISILLFMLNTPVVVGETEYIILVSGIFVTALWFALGFYVIRFESKLLAWIFMVVSLLEPGYVTYKLIITNQELDHPEMDDLVAYTIMVGAIFAYFLRIMVLLAFVMSLLNFGLGIRQLAFPHPCVFCGATLCRSMNISP